MMYVAISYLVFLAFTYLKISIRNNLLYERSERIKSWDEWICLSCKAMIADGQECHDEGLFGTWQVCESGGL